jgi:hypothetical protein
MSLRSWAQVSAALLGCWLAACATTTEPRAARLESPLVKLTAAIVAEIAGKASSHLPPTESRIGRRLTRSFPRTNLRIRLNQRQSRASMSIPFPTCAAGQSRGSESGLGRAG